MDITYPLAMQEHAQQEYRVYSKYRRNSRCEYRNHINNEDRGQLCPNFADKPLVSHRFPPTSDYHLNTADVRRCTPNCTLDPAEYLELLRSIFVPRISPI